MNFDIAFGQYFEGSSILHKLDPRFKILMSICFIVVLFLAKSVIAFALLSVITIVLMIISRIPVKIFLRSMRAILFIVLFTAIVNIFWYSGDTLLVSFWIINIYLEGVINAALIVLRIVILIASTGLFLTYTTTPLALTDGLEQLLSPLKKLHIPIHEFSMMMTIALRFIPTLMEETQKIMNAQKSRGADFTSGSLISRIKALIPILIPLFVSAFRRADELATAMECRCYAGGNGRTRMNVLHAKAQDFVFVGIVIIIGVAVVLLNTYFPVYALVI